MLQLYLERYFKLLDRDDRNASQYPDKPSEDIKAYLAKELGGRPEQYDEIKIPDNMYIWSTMNSADPGRISNGYSI